VQPVRGNPLLERRVSGLELVIGPGVDRRSGQPARQCFGHNAACPFAGGPFAVVGCDSHSRFQGHQAYAGFEISGNRVARDGYSPLLRIEEYLKAALLRLWPR
jgi:hypothetical protein